MAPTPSPLIFPSRQIYKACVGFPLASISSPSGTIRISPERMIRSTVVRFRRLKIDERFKDHLQMQYRRMLFVGASSYFSREVLLMERHSVGWMHSAVPDLNS